MELTTHTTLNGGSLGLWSDEDRSKVRELWATALPNGPISSHTSNAHCTSPHAGRQLKEVALVIG